jgi:hypothetical protein
MMTTVTVSELPYFDRAAANGSHERNTAAMLAGPRCGAKTRAGAACRSPAVKGKRRCRMHGGAQESGAPKGNQNALKHGTYTKAAFRERAEMRHLLQQADELLRSLEEPTLTPLP